MKDILEPFRQYLEEISGAPIQRRPTLKIDQLPGESDAAVSALADQTFMRMVKMDNPESVFAKMPNLGKEQMGLFYNRIKKNAEKLPGKKSDKIKAGLLAFKNALGHADTIQMDPPSETIQDFPPMKENLDMKEVIKEAKDLIDSLIKE